MATAASRFVWYELMTTDADAAANFYRDVVGWTVEKTAMPNMEYTLFKAGAAQVAGAFALGREALEGGARPAWVGYVGVENVDMAAADVKAAAGTVFRGPDDIPGVGRFAMVADPQGAVFALFHSADASDVSPADPSAPGHFSWNELYAGDGRSILPFYSNLFGWVPGDAMDMGPAGKYQMFGTAPGTMIGGVMTKPAQMPAPAWMFYVTVPSVDAAAAKVKSRGGQILNGPQEVPGGQWTIQGLDPQGAHFALVGAK